jgi:hypothetical protein
MPDLEISTVRRSVVGGNGISDRDTPLQACGRDARGSETKKEPGYSIQALISERIPHRGLDTPSAKTPTHTGERSVRSFRRVVVSTSAAC